MKCHWLNGLIECFEIVEFPISWLPPEAPQPLGVWSLQSECLTIGLWEKRADGSQPSHCVAWGEECCDQPNKWGGGRGGRERERVRERDRGKGGREGEKETGREVGRLINCSWGQGNTWSADFKFHFFHNYWQSQRYFLPQIKFMYRRSTLGILILWKKKKIICYGRFLLYIL